MTFRNDGVTKDTRGRCLSLATDGLLKKVWSLREHEGSKIIPGTTVAYSPTNAPRERHVLGNSQGRPWGMPSERTSATEGEGESDSRGTREDEKVHYAPQRNSCCRL